MLERVGLRAAWRLAVRRLVLGPAGSLGASAAFMLAAASVLTVPLLIMLPIALVPVWVVALRAARERASR